MRSAARGAQDSAEEQVEEQVGENLPWPRAPPCDAEPIAAQTADLEVLGTGPGR